MSTTNEDPKEFRERLIEAISRGNQGLRDELEKFDTETLVGEVIPMAQEELFKTIYAPMNAQETKTIADMVKYLSSKVYDPNAGRLTWKIKKSEEGAEK